ncbi:MAG: 16S rRNA (guanine(527)-N(7))-methyltransferase RsmG [Terriglobales bacterium]|jgi:16S rRNA (guanine527-N7)-methyltransferase|nr:16S rRNA (guanine(527)-N(7))-methyltransferase RsmG [Terriglobales bacterium]
MQFVDHARIAELLRPFLEGASASPLVLSEHQLADISTYLDTLLRWNARINLTAIRDPEEIVTRHFGESLFAARHLFPDAHGNAQVIDVGSGAGFPGLPIKLWAKDIHATLIESNHKKATFLREVIRALKLEGVEVFAGRAEEFSACGDVVTLRAVEHFESAIRTATNLVKPDGRVVLLIGVSQNEITKAVPEMSWLQGVRVPESASRILLIGTRTRNDKNTDC